MSSHAKLSPSSSSRWLACPGSIPASEGIPDSSSVFADEGTFAHAVAADCLEHGVDAESELGTVSHCGRFTFNEDDAEHVQRYLDTVRELLVDGARLMIETKVVAIKGKVYGTADAIVHDRADGGTLHVMDLKYGRGVLVDVRDNSQLKVYAIGAMVKVTSTGEAWPERVVMHVHQPRHAQGGHSFVETTGRSLSEWRTEVLKPGADAANDARLGATSDVREAGSWCRFCPAKVGCPAIRRASLETAVAVFDDIETLEPARMPMRPTDLTPAMVGDLLAAFPMVESWIADVRAHAYELAEHGHPVPGFKLVKKKSNRVWTDEPRARAMLLEMLPEGESPDAPAKMLSPSQAEKKLDLIGKALVAKLTKKPDAGTVLASSSDKRPAFSAGDVFPVVES